MTKLLPILIAMAACAATATSEIEQDIGACPSNPPMRCQANLWSSDQDCTDACSEQIGGGAEAYCPEITPAEQAGCGILCAGIPNVRPTFEWSACINRCYSTIMHTCVGGRLP